ncbi:MAG: BrnT family toxin [Gammaproteobacteria bacterium]
MDLEWDPDKEQVNIAKHGVSFSEAMSVFGDPLETTIADPDHSEAECRYLGVGLSWVGDCWSWLTRSVASGVPSNAALDPSFRWGDGIREIVTILGSHARVSREQAPINHGVIP